MGLLTKFNIILFILIIFAVANISFASEDEHDKHDESSHASEDDHDESSHASEDEHDESSHASEDKHDTHDESSHDESGYEEESEEGIVELSRESILAAGIQIKTLSMEVLPEFISAPGEVQLDQYSSAEVTPLVDAVVIKRHARLGDEVETDQPLVTLASVDVAAAQGDLRIASTEWKRMKKLGQAAVSAKRFIEAEVAYEQARLKLSVYGLDDKQIDAVASRNSKSPLGQFNLNSPVPGTVLRDDFRVGQRIDAGQSLFLIADESQVWVQANLSPHQAKNIRIGIPVRVNMGGHWHDGTVIQKHHLLDPQTRTVPLRIAVEPNNEHHHAGEFVRVEISVETKYTESMLVVPESALMQDDEGGWAIFVEYKKGRFKQTGILRGPERGGKVPISGIEPGISVVTEGAFFLAAELAKSGFDIHNH